MKRATSVYFPGFVVPMLPETLSNGICSLNPKVERLCMVCDMIVGHDGEVVRSKFYAAVMRSHARLTYTRVWQALGEKNVEARAELADVLAKAVGFRGTMAEYLFSTVQKLEELGIHDRNLWRLQALVADRIDAAHPTEH